MVNWAWPSVAKLRKSNTILSFGYLIAQFVSVARIPWEVFVQDLCGFLDAGDDTLFEVTFFKVCCYSVPCGFPEVRPYNGVDARIATDGKGVVLYRYVRSTPLASLVLSIFRI